MLAPNELKARRLRKKLTKVAPSFAVISIHVDDGAEKLEGLVESLAALEQHADGVERGDGLGVGNEGTLVGLQGLVRNAQELGEATCAGVSECIDKLKRQRSVRMTYRFAARPVR